jgi:hypothetical protein
MDMVVSHWTGVETASMEPMFHCKVCSRLSASTTKVLSPAEHISGLSAFDLMLLEEV